MKIIYRKTGLNKLSCSPQCLLPNLRTQNKFVNYVQLVPNGEEKVGAAFISAVPETSDWSISVSFACFVNTLYFITIAGFYRDRLDVLKYRMLQQKYEVTADLSRVRKNNFHAMEGIEKIYKNWCSIHVFLPFIPLTGINRIMTSFTSIWLLYVFD